MEKAEPKNTREIYLDWLRRQPPSYLESVQRRLAEEPNRHMRRHMTAALETILPAAPVSSLASVNWEERLEALKLSGVTDDEKRKWLLEGFQTGDEKKQLFALEQIPPLNFSNPFSCISALNESTDLFTEHGVLNLIKIRIWNGGKKTITGAPLVHLVSSFLLMKLMALSPTTWAEIPYETLSARGNPCQREQWARLGLGFRVSESQLIVSQTTRNEAFERVKDETFILSLSVSTLNAVRDLEPVIVRRATEYVLSDATGEAFDRLSPYGLTQVKNAAIASHRKPLLRAIIASADRKNGTSPGMARIADACLGSAEVCKQKIITIAKRYLEHFGPSIAGMLTSEDIDTRLNTHVQEVETEAEVKIARANARTNFIFDVRSNLNGESETLIGYLFVKAGSELEDYFLPPLVAALSSAPQRVWLLNLATILEDPTMKDAEIKIQVIGDEEEKEKKESEPELPFILASDILNPTELAAICEGTAKGDDAKVQVLHSEHGHQIRVCHPLQLKTDAARLQSAREKVPSRWKHWGAIATIDNDDDYFRDPSKSKVKITPQDGGREIKLTLEEAGNLSPTQLEVDNESRRVKFNKRQNYAIVMGEEGEKKLIHEEDLTEELIKEVEEAGTIPAHFWHQVKTDDLLFADNVLQVPGDDGVLTQIFPIKSFFGSPTGSKEITTLEKLSVVRAEREAEIKAELWEAHPLKALTKRASEINVRLTISKAKDTISAGRLARLSLADKISRTIYKRSDTFILRDGSGKIIIQSKDQNLVTTLLADLETNFTSSLQEHGEPRVTLGSLSRRVTYSKEKSKWILELTNQELFNGMSESEEGSTLPKKVRIKAPLSAVPLNPFSPRSAASLGKNLRRNGFDTSQIPFFAAKEESPQDTPTPSPEELTPEVQTQRGGFLSRLFRRGGES